MHFDYDKIIQEDPQAQIVGIFGGTFDPPHAGHVSVVNFLLASGYFHGMKVFPVNQHPHCKEPVASFKQRLSMTRRVFSFIDKHFIYVADTSHFCAWAGIGETSYELLTAHKDSHIVPVLIVGQDISEDVIAKTWYRGKDIVTDFYVYNFPRGVVPCSSTLIREAIAAGRPHVAKPWLHRDVFRDAQEIYRKPPCCDVNLADPMSHAQSCTEVE